MFRFLFRTTREAVSFAIGLLRGWARIGASKRTGCDCHRLKRRDSVCLFGARELMACRTVEPSSDLRGVGLVVSLIYMPSAVTFFSLKSDSSSVNLDSGKQFITVVAPSPIVWLSLLTSADCRPRGGQPDLSPLSSVQSRSVMQGWPEPNCLFLFPDLHNVDMGQGSYLRILPFVVPFAGHALSRPLSYRNAHLSEGGNQLHVVINACSLVNITLPGRMRGQSNHVCRLKRRGGWPCRALL